VPRESYHALLYPGEVAVVIVEWVALRLVADQDQAVRVRSRAGARLFAFVLLANTVSFLAGWLL